MGLIWGFIFFATISLLFGFIGFQVFYKDQYYFYFNLGISKWKLLMTSFIINLFVGIPAFSILIILIFFMFGNIQIT